MTGLADHVAAWEPEPIEESDTIGARPSTAFAAVLDQASPIDAPDAELPLGWHRFHFLEAPATAELGEDGHVREGHFLPPIPNRRRMFAGGRLTAHAPIRVGDDIVRRSEITSVEPKTGRSGEMLFVTLRQEFRRDGELVLVEEEDAVYRQQEPGAPRAAPEAPQAGPVPDAAPWRAMLHPDEAMLLRFSALTYNAHRIHYDLPYARDVEGFPGLLVHGPLLALLLLELPRRFTPDRRVAEFAYRLKAPSFAGAPIVADGTLTESGADLAAGVPDATPAITGTITYS
ncbi:MAG: MaoC family dehydratase N-terminal domain-containing protein [Pseudonocardia sp.]|nr:MaoC family dehydratase N-terminal domain-containing protein [Pseudonocardia sp.]